MPERLKQFRPARDIKVLLIILLLAALCGILSLFWKFWFVFTCILFVILFMYFSKGFKDIMNIHSVAISLIVVYAVPSTVLILLGEIPVSDTELMLLLSSISIGLIGYSFGTFFTRKLFPFWKTRKAHFSNKANTLFWMAYRYRYILALISAIIYLGQGFMPTSMSYGESITYRMETPGVIQYFNALASAVFSLLLIAIISIVGDIKKHKKLSLLSYLLILFVIVAIIGGQRIWIIALFGCLLIAFSTIMKRKHFILVVALSVVLVFVLSGGVRYARSMQGGIGGNLKGFIEYFSTPKTLRDIMWGCSDFTLPFSSFVDFVKNMPDKMHFHYNAYINDFSLLIPTIIYPTRPLPYSKWYMKVFYPELYAIGAGHSFYVIGFGYLFGGPLGVLLHLFLFGILFELINELLKTIGGAAAIFLYSFFFAQLFAFVTSCGFASFIKTSIIMYFLVPLFLLLLFVMFLNMLRPRRVKSE